MLNLIETEKFENKPEFEILGIARYSEDPEIRFTIYKINGDFGNQTELKSGRYEHFKGGKYNVLGIATHKETSEKFVFYQAAYSSEEFGENTFWVRPLDNFLEKKPMGFVKVPKFLYVGD